MKKITLFFALALMANLISNAQYELPVTWENDDETADWTPFENDGDAPENFVIVANPENAGINTSDNCLQYTVLPTAQPWVGAWSTAYGEMEFTGDNYILQMMVYKDVISPCALKVEGADMDPLEVHVENTLINEWELLTFDFADAIGTTRATLVFFPDFPSARTEGSVCYVDNIGWASDDAGTAINNISTFKTSLYPNPANSSLNIDSENAIANITVYDLTGKQLLSVMGNKATTMNLDVSNLHNGLYLLSIKDTDGNNSAQKFQVK